MKPIEKLSRRHLINSSDVFVIKGFTVEKNGKYLLWICVVFLHDLWVDIPNLWNRIYITVSIK